MAAAPNPLWDALRDHYVVERELGRGGMATVYLARDLKHDRLVALKVLHPHLSQALGPERFLREVRIAAHLQHPHILTLIDSGEAGIGPATFLYYVMPYVDGETLRERLRREGRLPPADATRILREVLDALTHAHGAGVVHRDIKPENVMLTGNPSRERGATGRGHALVMDFGVAKAASAAADGGTVIGGTLTTLGLAIGTPTYMSPEQAAGQSSIDARSDLYAVGVVGYEMLAGAPPFTGATPQAVLAAQVTKPPVPLGEVRPDLAVALSNAIMRCLEKEPENRWPSAEELLAHLEGFVSGASPVAAGDQATTVWRKPRLAIGLTAILLLAVLGTALWLGPGRHARERRWAREQAIPRLLTLSEAGNWEAAYLLARRVDSILPRDSLFNALRPKFARRVNIRTNPPGAKVWRKDYAAPDSAWTLLGRTPLDSTLIALAGSGFILNLNRFRIEAPGYRTLELVGLPFEGSVITLDRNSGLPPEMVRIGGGELSVVYPGLEYIKAIRLPDYLMDRFEVTNEEFKRFLDSGGYRRRELWEHPFVKDGRTISWDDAMKLMVDRTGRPGPSTWEAGEYPAGQAHYPVAGASWYEAAAFAKFAGKSLPTVVHWNHAAGVPTSASVVPISNFGGKGPVPVGSTNGINWFGTFDMAGNVREWCLNASGDQRFILGGGWNDEPYQFTDAFTQPAFDRSPTNGIRLVKYLSDSNLTLAGQPLHRAYRDFMKERPVSDDLFAVYRRMYDYDRSPLNAKVLETVDESDWVRELTRMDAAYGGDSLLVYLYLPKRGIKPYPVVVYFPGSNAIRDHAPQNLQWRPIDFIIKSGRAVIYPVYKGTYQRSDSLFSDVQDSTTFYRDHVIMWAKDLRRAIDYAETRRELATDHLAYYGVSWGGAMGALMPAVEPRIKVSVLLVAGLSFERARPEVEPVNFLPRITIPTLMLNGRYDFFFPLETSQVPMFRLLGTPPDQKRQVVEEGSHFVPRTRLIQETLAWLDRYQPLPPAQVGIR